MIGVLAMAVIGSVLPPPVIDGNTALPVDDGPMCVPGEVEVAPEPEAYTPPVGGYDAPTEWERSVIEMADADCVNSAGTRQARPGMLDFVEALAWIRHERSMGMKRSEMGLHLAAWCREGSYLSDGWCKRGSCDGGLADGPLQMHLIFARLCWDGVDKRSSPRASIECYLDRVMLRLEEVEERCGERNIYAAQAWVASAPRYYPDCDAVSQHGEIHKRWIETIQENDG